MNVTAFSLNEIGGRKNVEDAIMPKQFRADMPQLFIVCDGVGGASFGEVASELATKNFYSTFENAVITSQAVFSDLLNKALASFQKEVKTFVDQNPSASGTSTTLTLLVIQQNKAWLAWCGDSKIFQIRNGSPIYKSRDHSLVAELIAQGVITAKEAETHPQRNIITRSLNSNTKASDIEINLITDIRKGDWFLLCTDGLMEQFTESMFPSILNDFDAGRNYTEIIDNICKGKTKDNYSMYLLHCGEVSKSSAKWLIPLIAILLVAGGWFTYNRLLGAKETPDAPAQIEKEKEPEVKSIMMVKPQSADDSVKAKNDSTKKDSLK